MPFTIQKPAAVLVSCKEVLCLSVLCDARLLGLLDENPPDQLAPFILVSFSFVQ